VIINQTETLEQTVDTKTQSFAQNQLGQPQSPAVSSRIQGTGSYVPENAVSNQSLADRTDTSDKWIASRTGIRERRIASPHQTTSDLASHAASSAIESAGISNQDIDLIIVATVTADQPLPSTAMHIKKKLRIRNSCPAFDIAAACSGFVYGMHIADCFIKSGAYRCVLVIGVELLSRFVDWRDRNSCVLFGDGAGAVVLTPVPRSSQSHISSNTQSEIIDTQLYSDATLIDAIQIPAGGSLEPASRATVENDRHHVQLDGKKVFKFAVERLVQSSCEMLRRNRLRSSDIDWVVPHQANLRILSMVSQQCEIDIDRFLINIDRYGNTSSASCPLAFDEGVRSGKIRRGDLILFCALGSGMVWGCSLVRF